ncbi:hypothetical protein IFM89_007999 [Coptis chinensis]|uniref:WAT1-related protein n=1 Tax=Coptis chinensis TaxID=261450 RepID=A0A835IQ86_9MAGN|nr:hypothetical protein IFM89_007999 [Coptis chinensis]
MEKRRPFIVIVIIQTIYAGMFLLSKVALDGGMNSFVFVFYRQAFATIFLVPCAFMFERDKAPPLSFIAFSKIFMLSLFGITISLNVYGIALVYTSATLAAGTANTLPVITFLMAVLLRMEPLKLRSVSGATKILGVILCLAGAATLAFYKGPHLEPLIHYHHFGHRSSTVQAVAHPSNTWIKGCFLMLTSNILWGLWLVLQGRVLQIYPSKLLFTTLQCFLSTIQSFIVAIVFERNTSLWKLHLDAGLLAVAYCGIMVTGVTFYLQAWCIEKKGPVFLAMSTPLSLIITILCSVLFLGEIISMGSVLGGIFLVGGLYCVLWGKCTEQMDEKLPVKDEKGNGKLVEPPIKLSVKVNLNAGQ